jgi:hypothetical protein
LFNAFTDPAPDRWGQTLLRRHERARARAEGRAARTLFAVDFLTLVDDGTRLGALRLREGDADTFLTAGGRVPPLVRAVAPSFGLKPGEVRTIVQEVAGPVRKWRGFAGDCGITKRQLDRMSTAFEHDDLAAAAKL